jgi:hypothetical protein
MAAAEHPTDAPRSESASPARRFVQAGLEPLGLELSEQQLAVIDAVDAIYRPMIEALMTAELPEVEPEPGADMSREPRTETRR